jgi:hypothetical protein
VAWRRGREAARLRGALDSAGGNLRVLPEPQLHALYASAVAAAGLQSRPAVRADMMRELFSRATTPHASGWACAGFGAAWLAALAGSLVVGVLEGQRGPARWTSTGHEAGFVAQFPRQAHPQGSASLVAHHAGVVYEAVSIDLPADPSSTAANTAGYAQRLAAAMGGEIVEEGPPAGDPAGWRVRAKGPGQIVRTYEVHPAGRQHHVLVATELKPDPARAEDIEHFLRSYARER